jgi:cytolysin (calcineurin-like family phosphatase)
MVAVVTDRFCTWLQEQARANEAALRWQNTPEEYKAKVKQDVLTALASQTSRVGAVAAQVLAAIAAIELPHQQWPDLINLLLAFVNNADNVNLRIATLQSIGYICETIVGTLFNHRISEYVLRNYIRLQKFSSFAPMRSSQLSFKAPAGKSRRPKCNLLPLRPFTIRSTLSRTISSER